MRIKFERMLFSCIGGWPAKDLRNKLTWLKFNSPSRLPSDANPTNSKRNSHPCDMEPDAARSEFLARPTTLREHLLDPREHQRQFDSFSSTL